MIVRTLEQLQELSNKYEISSNSNILLNNKISDNKEITQSFRCSYNTLSGRLNDDLSSSYFANNNLNITSQVSFTQTPQVNGEELIVNSQLNGYVSKDDLATELVSVAPVYSTDKLNNADSYKDLNLNSQNLPVIPFKDDGELSSYFVCDKTGMLTVYGWVADKGNVDPSRCWIALAGKNNDGNNIILQIQPWIQGQNHSVLQYFSFSIPVTKDLSVTVKTGFEPNTSNSGFQGRIGSLVENVDPMACAAVFYII